jgi:uncharacterized membrane protein HdeD (DUF308 family)
MTTESPAALGLHGALRRLYFTRFAFAVVWAVVLIVTGGAPSPFLTVWLLIYPLFDAASVLYQLRSEGRSNSPRIAEWLNVVLSVAAGVALAVTSTVSTGAALITWGVWAIVSGLLQLIVAILRRHAGGQVPLMISGAVSVLAGGAFAVMGAGGASSLTSVGGYATIGAILFLVSAIRLSVLRGRTS